jgi:hypothetical protein
MNIVMLIITKKTDMKLIFAIPTHPPPPPQGYELLRQRRPSLFAHSLVCTVVTVVLQCSTTMHSLFLPYSFPFSMDARPSAFQIEWQTAISAGSRSLARKNRKEARIQD